MREWSDCREGRFLYSSCPFWSYSWRQPQPTCGLRCFFLFQICQFVCRCFVTNCNSFLHRVSCFAFKALWFIWLWYIFPCWSDIWYCWCIYSGAIFTRGQILTRLSDIENTSSQWHKSMHFSQSYRVALNIFSESDSILLVICDPENERKWILYNSQSSNMLDSKMYWTNKCVVLPSEHDAVICNCQGDLICEHELFFTIIGWLRRHSDMTITYMCALAVDKKWGRTNYGKENKLLKSDA